MNSCSASVEAYRLEGEQAALPKFDIHALDVLVVVHWQRSYCIVGGDMAGRGDDFTVGSYKGIDRVLDLLFFCKGRCDISSWAPASAHRDRRRTRGRAWPDRI